MVVEVSRHRAQGKDFMEVRVALNLISVVALPWQTAGMADEGEELRCVKDASSGHGGVCVKQK